MKLDSWYLIDEPGIEPLVTKRDEGWAHIEANSQGEFLDIRHCGETQRAQVPVAVIEALIAAWRRKKGP